MQDQPASPGGLSTFELHSRGLGLLGLLLPLSLVAVEFLFTALLLWSLLQALRSRQIRLTRWHLPVLAFVLIRLTSGLFAAETKLAVKGLTYLLFCAAFAITAWNTGDFKSRGWSRFVRGLVVGCALSSLWGIVQVLAGAQRATGFYGGWTVFGSLTGAALVLGSYQAISGGLFSKKYLNALFLLLIAAGLAASSCRAEWVAAVLVLLPAGVIFYPRLSVLLGLCVVVLFLAIQPLRERLLTLGNPVANLSGREVLWQPTVKLMQQEPLFGYGLNSFHAIFPPDLRPQMSDPGAGDWHNVYLQVALESGLIGLAAFLWLLATGLYLAVRGVRRARSPAEQAAAWGLFAGLAFFCIAGGLGVFLVRIPVVILVFLLLGTITQQAANLSRSDHP